ncbi:outer membrane protein assembly factor BamE [Alteromonas pelagimontana]|uniref:Outer membrane protein assembly factor BamE n=1 Tax=Alteromonas pelagimontana TaxID=1858656 RepID=A0A6M4M993_9ALTE|nr:outer membrane protein assembly factor BamE [Alteromonas pelagimontana]QJR79734.1 outer membrane protein assembly factor BamE [Alteromonas pelagimontana]
MKLYQIFLLFAVVLSSTACSNWIYRIDVPQGNFLDDRDVKKLRIGMSKEQVIYVLGRPVVKDSFDHDTWYYVYDMKRGMSKRGKDFQKQMVISFEENKVAKVEGDFELSEDFNTPLDE